jgi:hypothetical protein
MIQFQTTDEKLISNYNDYIRIKELLNKILDVRNYLLENNIIKLKPWLGHRYCKGDFTLTDIKIKNHLFKKHILQTYFNTDEINFYKYIKVEYYKYLLSRISDLPVISYYNSICVTPKWLSDEATDELGLLMIEDVVEVKMKIKKIIKCRMNNMTIEI